MEYLLWVGWCGGGLGRSSSVRREFECGWGVAVWVCVR